MPRAKPENLYISFFQEEGDESDGEDNHLNLSQNEEENFSNFNGNLSNFNGNIDMMNEIEETEYEQLDKIAD